MTSAISLAFGTKNILQNLQAQNPQNKLISLSETSGVARLMLLDVSGLPTVFANPITFKVLNELPQPAYKDFFAFINLQLDPDHAKILRASVDHFLDQERPLGLRAFALLEKEKASSEYTILMSWDHVNDYHAWISSTSFAPFESFYKQSQYSYRETAYNRVNLTR
ncbi:MAG: hypothetical protein LKG79_00100 [Furfurilactobacillus sp.]|jgi:heme-degrading monooxygenase HmoA|uniref:ABM domain-containing protein n=1 Tax=Furfurilactobacillus milii TaxID=2888272 RepID=A0ABT6D668_9LACO|nr:MULTISPECIES: hypothetical protein [Furfurilactobacillus]QLE66217.1 hypothetical protein LROSL2_0867 [Furfurilactobacillus rossiae]MCF6159675.1 hypothetical protein [Furfurilactobacillus milii]MCF6163240.1 hypothetical protein [Furfurilactobacillus milii]MCF6420493.1 hypothetical protein [Furfurilactobacillus milii]MCH4011070.1 hypothetical protein [Furfurilactobacillus sp.]